jgi:hypothetical protein
VRGNSRGKGNVELCQFTGKEWILRKLCDELCKLGATHFWLLLAQGRQRQQIALLKQISGRIRRAPKGVFRMRLPQNLKLVASFLRL